MQLLYNICLEAMQVKIDSNLENIHSIYSK